MARLKAFLNVYGVVSIVLFGGLFSLTLFDAPIMQDGGACGSCGGNLSPSTSS